MNDRTDGLRVRYGENWATLHGREKGNLYTFKLDSGEKINSVSGRNGGLIDQLQFSTNKGRMFGPVGGSGGNNPWNSTHEDCGLAYLAGRSGAALNSLTLYWSC